MIRRGDIRWFRFDHPNKRRPVVVLGQDGALSAWTQVPVVPLSTQVRNLPWEVRLTPDDGLPETCVMKPEWIRSVERALPGPYLATFPDHRWREVRAARLQVLGFEPD